MKKINKIYLLDGATGTILQKLHPDLYSLTTWMNEVIKKFPNDI